MSGIYDLTGQNIENTYQRVVQTPDGINYYDGTGSLLPLSSSFLSGASAVGSTITFTRGDGSTFPVTVAAGTGAPGGPNTSVQFNGNGVFSGSSFFTFNSASDALTLTGSLNITGSTTQVGNNALLGNTTLSGSIIISGAYGTNNPTVRIYGDTEHNGYIRFDPVTTNIDNSLSASYIYVSGSTNDLYFSQNGSGYGNTTRLRWLEGNLYTGLLHGGLITTQSSTVYQIASGSGVIVNLNASIANDPYPTIQFLSWPNLSASIAPLSASYDQSFVGINSLNVITASGVPFSDGEYNTLIPIGVVLHQNRSTINAVQTFPSVGYGWKQRSYDFIKAFGPLKIAGYALSPSSSRGLLLTGGTAWVDGRNYTIDPNNPSYIVEATGITTSKIYRYYQSGSNWVYDTNAGAGYTTIDPTQYSNSGSLTPVGTNDWTIQRVFYFPNSATKALYVYYGNATYSSKDNAIAGILTEPFNEAPNTAANAIFVGYMILRSNASFNTAASYEFRAGGLFRGISGGGGGGGGGGATTLAGLTDVSLSSLSYGDLLMYNASTGLWNNTHTLSGSYILTGSLTTNDGLSVQSITASFISASSITGSLFGTASYATTASYALNGGVTQLLAGSNISLSPTNGLGQVTISSTGGGGGTGNTATGSYGSFYSTQTQTATAINTPTSMSFNTVDISNGVSISGSTSSSIKITNAGVYNVQFSAQLARNAGSGTEDVLIWLRKNGSDLSWTNTDVTFAGGTNIRQVAAWNWFINSAANDYYELMWSTTSTNIIIESNTTPNPDVPSVILTVNRVDQFLSNTGSFSGSFTGQLIGTASWANNAVTASFLPLNTYQITSSWALNSVSAITATNANNVFVKSAGTEIHYPTLVQNTSSYQEIHTDASFYYNPNTKVLTAYQYNNSSSGVINPITSSWAVSASNASTASYTLLTSTASYVNTEATAVSKQYYITFVDSNNTPASPETIYTDSSISYNSGTKVLTSNFAGNLTGTSSWASNASTASFLPVGTYQITASQASTASFITASNVQGPYGSNSILSASYALSASWAPGGGGSTSPGGNDTYIQFNSQSAFGGNSNLKYQYDSTAVDAYRLDHVSSTNFTTTAFTVDSPASVVINNDPNGIRQRVGITNFQYTQTANTVTTPFFKFDAGGSTGGGTTLNVLGFKCDYSLAIVDGSNNFVATRIGTLQGVWDWDQFNEPILQDNFINGDISLGQLQNAIFTLKWGPGTEVELKLDTSTVDYNVYFNGLFNIFSQY